MGDEPSAMNPASREQALFAEALLRETPEARTEYLALVCGSDTALRRRVDDLLRAADMAGDFLEKPPVELNGQSDTAHVVSEKPGDRIGRFKLLEEIGEGGCGVVYMAEQEEPVRRRVALKIIKLGMDTRAVVARFEAERQALALMDHPNIAKVFDGGATQTGRPYFVMELVRGVRITEFCHDAALDIESRLRLFVQVCHAVQHAHQKGIIHRDLKPSNILVTVNDGVPVPKVIDFGIVKAAGQRLTDKTLFTQFHAFLGTPAYTSPEQAEMSSVDVDTRSDIYSLGVLLYELLTGCTPFDGEDLLSSGLDEMRRTIREKEPLKPSTRLTRERSGALISVQPNQKSRIKHQKSQIDPDLDWIVMKCLEKDRARRYETVTGLAADIERYLNHEPIQARPVTALGRLWRWRQRRPAVAALSACVLLLLLVLTVGSTVAVWRVSAARRAEHAERTKAESANRELRSTNTRLADTVSLLELQSAEDFFRDNDPTAAVALLTSMLRRDPSRRIAASRLVSALTHRDWALPTSAHMIHGDRVVAAAFQADGRSVLSASWDGTAQLWDADTGKRSVILRHRGRVQSACFSSDGNRILTASADGRARIWNTGDGVLLATLDHQERSVREAVFSKDGRFVLTTCFADNSARVWNAADGMLFRELSGHGSEVQLARFSPDAQRVATGTESGSVRIWDRESGTMLVDLKAHWERVRALAFSPDGRTLVSAGADDVARLWNAADGQSLCGPLRHGDDVNGVTFSPDGGLVLTVSQDNMARLWNATNGFMVGQPMRHEGGVNAGTFNPEGSKILTSSMDNSARLWDVSTGRPLCQPLRHHEAVLQANFSPDGQRAVTASWDQSAQVWDIQPRREVGVEMSSGHHVLCVAFDPKGLSVVGAYRDGTARLWEARTGAPRGAVIRHQAAINHVAYSSMGDRVVTASHDGTAGVWDAVTGQLLTGPLVHANAVWFAEFSPDGQLVVTASADGTARIWDAASGQPTSPPLRHGDAVRTARFSADGKGIVTASADATARVWDAKTGEPVTPGLLHEDHVEWADFSPDGRRVISAASDNTARIWDARSGQPVGLPLQHARTVQKAVFSPDGRRVATASLDRTARIWDAATGEALILPAIHDRSVSEVSFSPDGRRFLTSCWSGTSRLWDVDTGQPLTEWMDAGGPRFIVCFDATGRRVLGATRSGALKVWDIGPPPTPVPEWFLTLAEAVSGARLNSRGHLELVSPAELRQLTAARSAEAGPLFYDRLARWIVAEPGPRLGAPFQEGLEQ